MTGVELIAAERKRQIEVEGFDARHDERHDIGDLALAGACYVASVVSFLHHCEPERKGYCRGLDRFRNNFWPWSELWWKPTPNDHICQLVKASALMAAEIDKLLREQK